MVVVAARPARPALLMDDGRAHRPLAVALPEALRPPRARGAGARAVARDDAAVALRLAPVASRPGGARVRVRLPDRGLHARAQARARLLRAADPPSRSSHRPPRRQGPSRRAPAGGSPRALRALVRVGAGVTGRLAYRGYAIADLARQASFEEVAHLLWRGDLPTAAELDRTTVALIAARDIPRELVEAFRLMPNDTDPMRALQAAVALLGMRDP